MHFLFGYGSLINDASRARTEATGPCCAARVLGYARSWNARTNTGTYLGLKSDKTGKCNGVLCEVSAQALLRFDARERGYRRESVPRAALEIFGDDVPNGAAIWTYVIDLPRKPTVLSPILQSYVDVVLDGCLAISTEFASEFLRSTTGWEHPWHNDRTQPRYVRADSNILQLEQIDCLLEQAGLLRHRE